MKIAVPPAYENVWYCPLENGHLQATGIASNKKKQYFYHHLWDDIRKSRKYSRLGDLGYALPAFRKQLSRFLAPDQEYEDKVRVLSAMARLLDRTGIRIGNEEAVKESQTKGLTTLTKENVDLEKDSIRLRYIGKGGVELEKQLKDRRLSQVIDECVEIPGQRLFEYEDEQGQTHLIQSGMLNSFLKENLGDNFSAKDFRTWRFNCLFVEETLKIAPDELTLSGVLEKVAAQSGNTTSILRSSYIHPGLIELVKEKNINFLKQNVADQYGLRKAERQLLSYLASDHAARALNS